MQLVNKKVRQEGRSTKPPQLRALKKLKEPQIHIRMRVIEALCAGIQASTKALRDGHIDGKIMNQIESGHLAMCVQKATRQLAHLRVSRIMYDVSIGQFLPTSYGREAFESHGIRTIHALIFSDKTPVILEDPDTRVPIFLKVMHYSQHPKLALAA